jgi:mRNA interferase MazF
MVVAPARGDVYWTDLDPVTGSEIGKTRPAVIIQNDEGNRASGTTIVAAISSRYPDRPYPFVVNLPAGVLPRPSAVNCAQLRTVDKTRLHAGRIAKLDPTTMTRVDAALRASLGLR